MAQDERFDGLLLNMAQSAGRIDNIFDSFFGFMLRKTDFFVGEDDKSKAMGPVSKSFDKFWEAGRAKREEDAKRRQEADAEMKAKRAAKKLFDEEEWAKMQAAVKEKREAVVVMPEGADKEEAEKPASAGVDVLPQEPASAAGDVTPQATLAAARNAVAEMKELAGLWA